MRIVSADTSAFIALHDAGDGEHVRAVRALEEILDSGARLLATNFILDESITWFREDASARERVGRAILESSFVDYVRIEEKDEERAWHLCLKLRDKAFSFTDLTSFVLMERLKLRQAFTFDDDFRRYGRFQMIPH